MSEKDSWYGILYIWLVGDSLSMQEGWHPYILAGLQITSSLSGNFTNELKIFCEIWVREAHMMSASCQVLTPMNGPRAIAVQVYIIMFSFMQSKPYFGAFGVRNSYHFKKKFPKLTCSSVLFIFSWPQFFSATLKIWSDALWFFGGLHTGTV